MFFQGTLQEGIASAVQSFKTVVCFVTDGEAESQEWESELLVHDSVKPLLESHAVVLRLEAGSEGEGFLSQLYPIPKKPTLVVIKNAELKEYIAAGTSRELFLSRLQKSLQPTQPQEVPQPAPASQPQAGITSSAASAETSSGQDTPSSSSGNGAGTGEVHSVLAERAARLEAQRKKDAEEARRKRAEKTRAKEQELAAQPEKKSDPQNKHAEQVRKQKREAQAERQRILQAIEDDKIARRARQSEREAERRAAKVGEETGLPFAPMSQLLPSTGRLSEYCSLQVRMFDGSTIRSKFSSRNNLSKDVRQWVDDTRTDGKAPYTFKIQLTPLPNKTIDVTEEGKSLQELGLAPSATLILLPVQKSAKAYEDAAPGGNIVTRFFAYLLAIVTGFLGIITTFFSTLFSTAGPPAAAPTGEAPADRARARASGRDDSTGRVKRFGGGDERRRDQQFYNGNSTNFEPNIDDEDQ